MNHLKGHLWKAWRSQINHFCKTFCMIFVPLIFLFLQLSSGRESGDQEMQIFPAVSKHDILMKANSTFDVLFTPNTSQVQQLMGEFKKKFSPNVIDNFFAMLNETEMERWFSNRSLSNISYGIVFNNINSTNLNYSIRNNDFLLWDTELKFPIVQDPGPVNASDVYIALYFIAIQIAVNEAFLEINSVPPLPNWNLRKFPYPEHRRIKDFSTIYRITLPSSLTFGFMVFLLIIIADVGREKESGMRERIRMCGVKPWITYIAWIINYGVLALIISIGIAIYTTVYQTSTSDALFSKSDFLVIFITILLFYLSGIFCALAIAVMFPRVIYSITVGILLCFCSLEIIINKSFPLTVWSFICMIPNGFLVYTMNMIAHLEVTRTGATFKNLFTYSSSEDVPLPLGFAWIAALLGMILLFGIILCLDVVFPGKYGVPKSFCFINPKIFSCWIRRIKFRPKLQSEADDRNIDASVGQDNQIDAERNITFEPTPDSLPVGIKIRDISKHFGDVKVLQHFSIDIYRDEITALLGHNGAGKTTLLSIITGMLAPTGGTVQTADIDIFSNLDKYQSALGYCPQDDLLSPILTVSEHVIFFAMIKGYSLKLAKSHANELISKCGLTPKEGTTVRALSGGMRRKLCLAISLVADPKILILDEPTSGLDPQSKRQIWNMLLELRRQKTILLTTHSMEEADILGDRIAILSHGELKCYGSSLFLKRSYGSGYHVTILLDNKNNIDNLIKIVNQQIPDSSVVNESGDSITFQLPINNIAKFPAVFKQLEGSNGLGVTNLSVAYTNIDDVFQKVNEEEGVSNEVNEVDSPLAQSRFATSNEQTFSFGRTISVSWQRFCAISKKKMLWLYRSPATLHLIFLLIALPLLVNLKSIKVTEHSLNLDLELYAGSHVVLTNYQHDFANSFKNEIIKQGSNITYLDPAKSTIIDELLKFGRQDEAMYRSSMIIAADLNETSPTLLYSSIAIHAPPIAVNLLFNAHLDAASSNKLSITTYNHPFIIFSYRQNLLLIVAYTTLITLFFTLMISFFILSVHQERTTLFKEMQLLTGLSYPLYWIFTFICDFLIFASLGIISFVVVMFLSGLIYSYLISSIVILICLFGLSGLWCAYLFSYLFNNAVYSMICFSIVLLVLILAGVIFSALTGFKALLYVFSLNPAQPFASATFNILREAGFILRCSSTNSANTRTLCATHTNQFSNNFYLNFLAFDSILFMLLIFLIDSGFIWHYIKRRSKIPELPTDLDPDVFEEKSRVINFVNGSSDENFVLFANGLAKRYSRKVTAVRDVTFGVRQGQCFGLLGTNGAGKSTTFKMLTAYLRPTRGDAGINGYTLSSNRSKYLRQIGYCPQSNALLDVLTANETLRLFANLHGVRKSQIDDLVSKWISLLALTEYQDRKASTYSGGNLRKLSTAIALIGNSPVIFLDEPTAGVDPTSRRKMWQVLKMVQANNQTIVFTSHNMDECEVLCDRLTIIVQGIMQCIGNIRHLKQAYGKGYTILIKLGILSEQELSDLKLRISTVFKDKCILKDESRGLLHYYLEDKSWLWSQLFKTMADLKDEFPVIEDYLLSDVSLEELFISFAS